MAVLGDAVREREGGEQKIPSNECVRFASAARSALDIQLAIAVTTLGT